MRNAGPIDKDMDSKVTISMIEISQILVVVGIYCFQERHIFTSIKILSPSLDTTDIPSSRELQNDFLCETAKEDDTLWIISKGERPEIEYFSTYMTTTPSCAQKTAQPGEEDLYDIKKEGEYQDYIENWFQELTQPQYHSFF